MKKNGLQHLNIGYIIKTHGLKGDITAVIDGKVDFADHPTLFVERNGSLIPYTIEQISAPHTKRFIKFEGINTLEQAAHLKGAAIFVSKMDLPKLKKDQFYDDELTGFEVKDINYGELGHVKEIQNQGPNRLLVVINGYKEILVPVNGPFIKGIYKTKKVLILNLPEDFLTI